jgi:hypothetical protein
VNRAYSLLDIKSVDGPRRLFSGTATSPTTDRVGDRIDPRGVKFAKTMPLLLYHDSHKPVGEARFGKATSTGIPFEAQISQVDRPGVVQDRINEALDSLNATPPLIKAVSIGFRELEPPTYNKETGGFDFSSIEVLELSMVVIPANADATIANIKSFDVEQRSALRPAVPPPAGATASPRSTGRSGTAMKNTNEQIAELQQRRIALGDSMKTLMAGEMTEAQEAEYDGYVKELDATDTRLTRLEALERSQVASEPLQLVSHGKGNGRSPYRNVSVSEPDLPPGIAFTRAAICKVAARMDYEPAWRIAEQRYPSHPSIANYLKTTIPGGTTSGTGSGSPQSGWGDDLLALNTTFAGGFMDFLRPQTIVGRLNLTRVPFNTRIQSQTTGGSALWVGQGVQKPVTKYDFDALNLGFAKIAAICVLSDELIRFSSPNAETLVRDQLAKTIIERLDRDFIDPDVAAVANVSPASITRGATVLASAGASLANANTDIQNIIGQFIAVNQNISNLAWIMPNSLALSLSLMLTSLGNRAFPTIDVNGGTLAGFPVVTSQYASGISTSPTDLFIVILLNQSEIFLADDGTVTVDASNQASIEMSDNPSVDAGNVMVSMYQTNQVALRAERYINWARGRTTSVFVLGDVRWSA